MNKAKEKPSNIANHCNSNAVIGCHNGYYREERHSELVLGQQQGEKAGEGGEPTKETGALPCSDGRKRGGLPWRYFRRNFRGGRGAESL